MTIQSSEYEPNGNRAETKPGTKSDARPINWTHLRVPNLPIAWVFRDPGIAIFEGRDSGSYRKI